MSPIDPKIMAPTDCNHASKYSLTRRRCLLIMVIAISGLTCQMSNPILADGRPNFVVCIADDVSWDDLGCYGNRTARTPRIDALAANGLRFTEAYLTASSCSPSRSSIITGRYPHNLGPAAELHQPIANHIPWLPTTLRENGYHTAIVGKNHMTRQDSTVGAETWDHIDPGVTPDNHGAESKWVQTIQKRPTDKPFFFWFAAIDAHRDWDANREWDEARFGPKHLPPAMAVPVFLADDDATREDLASYHNELTRFDYFVGAVADALATEGVLDNTVLLVLADNGRPFPRGKTRLHDSGMKTAFVAHWPAGIKQRGSVSASLVSVIDIAPTLLELAGVLSPPPSVQGLSFAQILNDPTATIRQHAFSEHNWHDFEAHGRAVRSGGWLYIRNARPSLAWQGPADSVRSPSHASLRALRDAKQLTIAQADVFLAPRPPEELYFTPQDPEQLRNLATDPSHAETKNQLAAQLDQWIVETGDSTPEKLTADMFDRESGQPLNRGDSNRPKDRADFRGNDFPGKSTNAAQINAPGPR